MIDLKNILTTIKEGVPVETPPDLAVMRKQLEDWRILYKKENAAYQEAAISEGNKKRNSFRSIESKFLNVAPSSMNWFDYHQIVAAYHSAKRSLEEHDDRVKIMLARRDGIFKQISVLESRIQDMADV